MRLDFDPRNVDNFVSLALQCQCDTTTTPATYLGFFGDITDPSPSRELGTNVL